MIAHPPCRRAGLVRRPASRLRPSRVHNDRGRGRRSMRHTTRTCSAAFVLGLAALWSADAGAMEPPPICGDLCSRCVYNYARYTSGGVGDVAVTTASNPPTVPQEALAKLIVPLTGANQTGNPSGTAY